jgi:hypothetical protein
MPFECRSLTGWARALFLRKPTLAAAEGLAYAGGSPSGRGFSQASKLYRSGAASELIDNIRILG